MGNSHGWRRPRVVAVVSRKGGVGKTTTTVQLAYSISVIYKIVVLVVDSDPQANATARLGVKEGQAARTLNDVYTWALGDQGSLSHAIHRTAWEGVYLVASEEALKFRENEGDTLADYRFQISLERADLDGIGLVLVDTPPSTGGLLRNAMIGSDAVLAITDAEPDGLKGADKAVEAARNIQQRQNPDLDVLGIIVNRYDASMGEHARCVADLEAAHGDLVWKPLIPERASVKTARGLCRPVQEIRDNGARAYTRAMNDHARRLGRALNLLEP